MIESVYDAEGNEIGFVEYRDLTVEELNSTYKEEVKKTERICREETEEMKQEQRSRMDKELEGCSDESEKEIIRDYYRKSLETDVEDAIKKLRYYRLVIDVNGKYFHNHLEKIGSVKKYAQSRRRRGHPKREVNCWTKEERRELRRKEKKEYEDASPERKKEIKFNEEFCRMWDAPYRDYKNIWTSLYSKEGKAVGNMEEGLDTWWGLNLQTHKDGYFRLWYTPPKPREKIDLRKYAGFDNEEADMGFFGGDFYTPLFPGTMKR